MFPRGYQGQKTKVKGRDIKPENILLASEGRVRGGLRDRQGR